MRGLYYKLLTISIVGLLTINVLSFITNFNTAQLYNISFFDKRATGLYYLAKNIILETGVVIKKTEQKEIDDLISKAADIYNIDKKMLSLLIQPKNEYSVTITGGMGITAISPYDFFNSTFKNPYSVEENIMAAAEIIQMFKMNNMTNDEIIFRFITGKNNVENIKMIAKSEYDRAVNTKTAYNNTLYSKNKAK